MIEVVGLFVAVYIFSGTLVTLTLRREILAIRADVKDLDDRLVKIEARYGGPRFGEMLVGGTHSSAM